MSLSTRSSRHKQRQKFRDAPDGSPWNEYPNNRLGDIAEFDVVDAYVSAGGQVRGALYFRSALAILCEVLILLHVGQGGIGVALSSEDCGDNRIGTI